MWVPQYELRPGMQRSVTYGRPYIRCVPTAWLTDVAFQERVNDTRYNKTFLTTWISNNAASLPKWVAPLPAGAPANAVVGQVKFSVGDTAIFMPGFDVSDAKIAASRYLLIPPRKYDITLSPYMKKYNDTKRADLNYPSIRPVIVYRLAETYLIAAEAAYNLNNEPVARQYLNAVATRRDPNFLGYTSIGAQLLSDILLERRKELAFEGHRYWDLARNNLNVTRVNTAGNYTGVPLTFATTNFRRIFPIPQAELDANPAIRDQQNPGY